MNGSMILFGSLFFNCAFVLNQSNNLGDVAGNYGVFETWSPAIHLCKENDRSMSKKKKEEKEGDRCALCVKGTSFASESWPL